MDIKYQALTSFIYQVPAIRCNESHLYFLQNRNKLGCSDALSWSPKADVILEIGEINQVSIFIFYVKGIWRDKPSFGPVYAIVVLIRRLE